MPAEKLRTVWLTRYTLIVIAISIPAWTIAGVMWGTFMSLTMGGHVVVWAIGGAVWGIACWVFTSPLVLVGCRELVVRLSPFDLTKFEERLTESVRPLKSSVEQSSPFQYICTPSRGLPAVRKHAALEVRLHQAGVD
jgi:hypothetical protein